MTSMLCLNEEAYSTTRLLTKEKPKIINKLEEKFEMLLFLPDGEGRRGEGGLRTQGYFKKSYDGKPLISIITVVYNGEKYLEETIQSVVNQTYDNVEYIIIDGGSTDGTVDIIKKYEDQIDYWVSERDKGIYDAMNKGIALCCGEIIGIVNADDYLHVNTLKEIGSVFFDLEIMFVYGNLDLISEKGDPLDGIQSIGVDNIRFKLFKQMPFLHPSMFVRIDVYKAIGLFDTFYKLSADYDFTLRLFENNFLGRKLDFITGVFRLGGRSGGMNTYKENHKISLQHKTNFYIVYFNTVILILKMWTRIFFQKVKL